MTVTMRSPKYSDRGYTLIEMLVVLLVAGIIMGFAVPSLLALSKPLRDGTNVFKNQLSLIRSKAISSNQAYRIRPKYPTTAEYTGQTYQNNPHNFIVEYAANCQVTKYGTAPSGSRNGWMAASQLDLDLPEAVGVAATPLPQVNGTDVSTTTKTIKPADGSADITVTFEPYLSWEICYDTRGIAAQAVSLTLTDVQANNKATSALINVSRVGGVEVTTKDRNGNALPLNGDNPDF